jgi:hypothetical protein
MKLLYILTSSPQPQFWSSPLSEPFLSTLSLLSYPKNGCSIFFWKKLIPIYKTMWYQFTEDGNTYV